MQTNFEKYFEKRILKEFKELDATKRIYIKKVKKIKEIKIQKKNFTEKKTSLFHLRLQINSLSLFVTIFIRFSPSKKLSK